MSRFTKGLATVLLSLGLPVFTVTLVSFIVAQSAPSLALVLITLAFGLGYGLQAGILGIYDLSTQKGVGEAIVDLTWSLPNTVFGFVIGNLVYIFFGSPSRAESENQSWIVYKPRGSSGFGHSVLQTLGTVNIGGAGQHERMHLLQSRIFGPLYLVLVGLSYVVTSLIQLLWTGTLGLVLKLVGARDKPYFRPPAHSAVGGFFGWIYYATPMELWAYSSGNP
jgi:hypothetical protein